MSQPQEGRMTVYRGHFPPLDERYRVREPPQTIEDGEGRQIDIRAYGDGPVADERAALVELYLDYDPDDRTLGIPPVTPERIGKWQDAMLAGYCVLAWHGDRPVGQAVLVPDGDEGYEFAIFLDGEYQGAGIGTRLTEAVLSHGRAHGVEDVWLLVERDNRPAVRLYRTVGFVVIEDTGYDIEMGLSMGVERPQALPGAAAD
ncbi:GNAT family N-acetyltransferase [Haloglomus litoreum]|uniref:GNAT family N-acetyltransferase n=1 Tax=Haloglomus litoreum TaxID=3034026 RepID=UPI0023E76318|nr:GNAT family N-acetyltransferase [Haloglomus sp. DT116]